MDAAAALFIAGASAASSLLLARASARAAEAPLHVSSLHVYPVKGLRGHSVARAPLDGRGLMWDRRWMLLRGGEARYFTTQRQLPAMATVAATVLLPPSHAALAVPPAAVVDARVEVPSLLLEATAGPYVGRSLVVPLVTLPAEGGGSGSGGEGGGAPRCCGGGAPIATGARVLPPLAVWGSTVDGAVDQGDAAGAWLTAALVPEGEAAETLRLVYFQPRVSQRLVEGGFVPAHAPPLANGVAFADGFPLLLASTRSLGEGADEHAGEARAPLGRGLRSDPLG